MVHTLSCLRCQKEGVLWSPPQSLREYLSSLLFVSPFRCPSCNRFLASRFWLDHSIHPIDHRQHLQVPVRLYLSFSWGKVRGEGTVLDLLMGGCVIKSATEVHTDDIFYLQLSLGEGEQPLEVVAIVRSVSARGTGFKFLRGAQENKRLLAFAQAHVDPSNKSSFNTTVAA